MHTSSASINAMMISIVVLVIFMVTCLGLFYIKKKNAIRVFLIGTLGYFVPQIVIRYPLVTLFQTSLFSTLNIMIVILILSLSTAVVETAGRYVVFHIGLKNEQSKLSGMIAGLGHGFCEALFLVAITYINNLFIVYLAQRGGDSNQINVTLTAIGNVPLNIFYFTLLERCAFIIIQTGLSSVMMNGLLKNKRLVFLYVFLLHFIIDITITSLSTYGVSIVVIDSMIVLLAILAAGYMWKCVLHSAKQAQAITKEDVMDEKTDEHMDEIVCLKKKMKEEDEI